MPTGWLTVLGCSFLVHPSLPTSTHERRRTEHPDWTTDTDSGVVLPTDYTFTTGYGGDNGAHAFSSGGTLTTVGDQTLTVTDTVSGITGSVTITVGPGP